MVCVSKPRKRINFCQCFPLFYCQTCTAIHPQSSQKKAPLTLADLGFVNKLWLDMHEFARKALWKMQAVASLGQHATYFHWNSKLWISSCNSVHNICQTLDFSNVSTFMETIHSFEKFKACVVWGKKICYILSGITFKHSQKGDSLLEVLIGWSNLPEVSRWYCALLWSIIGRIFSYVRTLQ